jgi:hypothetical protein
VQQKDGRGSWIARLSVEDLAAVDHYGAVMGLEGHLHSRRCWDHLAVGRCAAVVSMEIV